jgi:hypothetical protein
MQRPGIGEIAATFKDPDRVVDPGQVETRRSVSREHVLHGRGKVIQQDAGHGQRRPVQRWGNTIGVAPARPADKTDHSRQQ